VVQLGGLKPSFEQPGSAIWGFVPFAEVAVATELAWWRGGLAPCPRCVVWPNPPLAHHVERIGGHPWGARASYMIGGGRARRPGAPQLFSSRYSTPLAAMLRKLDLKLHHAATHGHAMASQARRTSRYTARYMPGAPQTRGGATTRRAKLLLQQHKKKIAQATEAPRPLQLPAACAMNCRPGPLRARRDLAAAARGRGAHPLAPSPSSALSRSVSFSPKLATKTTGSTLCYLRLSSDT